ncbi:IclR family transcriptional regulator [Glutamicibacter sp. FBE19]|uniref:IclR family transcriptional regulator n=1 Tax=Glutamicibacter sp. FBE19 TaxID=2761534 RepID=UPI00189679A4|nr:IclR family transcriptional regulator [Glutamicibacter sp. FBE19]MBF6670492.1 IclR family transcriptional regulator [Glutamicibacter sp. FBE19]
MMEPSPGGSQTADRAIEVLRQIVLSDTAVLLEVLADRIGINRSVAYRLVRSLEHAGFVSRDPRQGGYTVGPAFLSISVLTASRNNIGRAVRPAMEEIVAAYGETVSFHVRSGSQRICVDVVEGTHDIRRVIKVGQTLPVYAGETGRVLLSGLPEEEIENYLEIAAASGQDPTAMRADILRIQQEGHIIGLGLRTRGVGTISLPVYGTHELLGALTISGPDNRWSQEAMEEALAPIRELLAPTLGLLSSRNGTTE